MTTQPTLTVNRDILLRELGRFVGWAREPSFCDERQHADADDILRRALSAAYYPAPIDDDRTSHSWSFLWPITEFSTKTNVGDYDLPDDFSGMCDDIAYIGNDATTRMTKISINKMLEYRRINVDTIGYPEHYAVVPQRSSGATAQRWTLMVQPIAQAAYQVRLRYKSDPLTIGESFPYPLGGQFFADVLTASVICSADEVLNDIYGGPSWQVFSQKLRTAVYLDRQAHVSGNLGYNGDGVGYDESRRDSSFTINGVAYGDTPAEFYFA